MSKSHKARHGTKTKLWKDTVYDSRCQVRAYAKKKRRRARKARRKQRALTMEEFRHGVQMLEKAHVPPGPDGCYGFAAPKKVELPPLPPGWQWSIHSEFIVPVACLMTTDIDCFVYVHQGSVCISASNASTSCAPVEVVSAVLKVAGWRP